MIFRYLIRCNCCNKNAVLRVSVPLAKSEGFLLPCPECEVALHGKMTFDHETLRLKIFSEDFEICHDYNLAKANECKVVTIRTDLLVHRTLHKKLLPQGGSPYLWAVELLRGKFLEYKITRDSLNFVRAKHFNTIKRAISYSEIKQWNKVIEVITKIFPIEGYYNTETENAIHSFYRTLTMLYCPLISEQEMVDIYDEYYTYVNDCVQNKRNSYRALLIDFYEKYGYEDYRKKVLGLYCRCLQHFDSYITGLIYDYLSDDIKQNINDYRVFRDDYDIVKFLYVDIFEAISMMLFYMGAVVNLSKRNSSYRFYNGINNAKTFRTSRASDKLKILDELTVLKKLIEKVSRPMRNDIGHFNAQYDFREGVLVYEDGSKTNYIVFLNQLLAAVKATWFLISVNEKIEIDMIRLYT